MRESQFLDAGFKGVEYITLTRVERSISESTAFSKCDGSRLFAPGFLGITPSPMGGSYDLDVPTYDTLVLEGGDWREVSSSDEDVIGTDERVRVRNTKVWPHRCVGKIRTTYPNGKTYIGSGVLISRNCVLTCAHNVYNRSRGGWGKLVEFRPAQNGQDTPYNTTAAIKLLATSGYTDADDGSSQHDYAVAVLSRSIGDEIGWWGYASETDQFFSARSFNVTGYPGDKGGSEMWTCEGAVSAGRSFLTYSIDTENGQSGGPVWTQTGDDIATYGVHITGAAGVNSAVRLSSPIFNQINRWVDANRSNK